MYRAQYKRKSPYESWSNIGYYGTEASAISIAITYKNRGLLMVRVLDKKGSVVYTG